MSISNESVLEIHARTRAHKDHLWEEHGERDMEMMGVIQLRSGRQVMLPTDLVRNAQAVLLEAIDEVIFASAPDIIKKAWEMKIEALKPAMPPVWLAMAIKEVREFLDEEDPVEIIFLAVDAHGRHCDEPPGPDYNHGDYQHEFENNPDTDITEIAMTFVAESNLVGGGTLTAVSQAYGLGDDGKLRWQEPEVERDTDEIKLEGAMCEVMRLAFVEGDVL